MVGISRVFSVSRRASHKRVLLREWGNVVYLRASFKILDDGGSNGISVSLRSASTRCPAKWAKRVRCVERRGDKGIFESRVS